MASSIFYSWQSDLPNSTNRNFLESVLEQSIRAVAADGELAKAERDKGLALDKDTKGVPGIPAIADVIFDKISNCAIFVPDLSFVGTTVDRRQLPNHQDGRPPPNPDGRPLPNPDVLIEYGWALSTVGRSQILSIMNTAYGEVSMETLPFDMRHLRHSLQYSLLESATADEKAEVRKKLVREVCRAISEILAHIVKTAPLAEPARHTPIASTFNPSTFLEKEEALSAYGSFGRDRQKLLLPDNQHTYLRLMPINVAEPIGSKLANELLAQGKVRPLGDTHGGLYQGRNRHGAFMAIHRDASVIGLTQLFLNKELWGIDAHGIDKEDCIRSSDVDFGFISRTYLEEAYLVTLSSYLRFCRGGLDLGAPLRMIAGLTGIQGYRMTPPSGMTLDGFNRFGGEAVKDNIEYTAIIEDLSAKPIEILLPFFEHIRNECGVKA